MFDIGFSELLIFAIIALVILGPDKLPQAVRSAGRWYAKIRYALSNVQTQIETEFNVAETRRQMEEELAKVRQIEANMQEELNRMRASVDKNHHLNASSSQNIDPVEATESMSTEHSQSKSTSTNAKDTE